MRKHESGSGNERYGAGGIWCEIGRSGEEMDRLMELRAGATRQERRRKI